VKSVPDYACDVVKNLVTRNGKVTTVAEYLGTVDGYWIAVPAIVGTQTKPPCARIDLFKQFVGLDLTKMYPAGGPPHPELSNDWTWDFFLQAAEKCFKGGYPFGMPFGQAATDATDWVGAVFSSYGAELIDKDGNITVKSDAVKQVLEWFKKAVPFFPPERFVAASHGYDLRPRAIFSTSGPGRRRGRQRARSTAIRRVTPTRSSTSPMRPRQKNRQPGLRASDDDQDGRSLYPAG
jgi:hypothetical protein